MRVPIARDGYRFMVPALLATVVMSWLFWPLAVLTGVALLFLVCFFRDFERSTPRIDGAVFASGDGVIDDIEEVDMPDFPGGRALKVGAFLSVFNCHITRSPTRGRVLNIRHEPGLFLNAMNRESSMKNENNRIALDVDGSRVLVRQIAGAIARRIVCTARIGQRLDAGERVGLIRMGSRVEVFVPVDSELRTRKGARVRAGKSVLAILKGPGGASHGATDATGEETERS